jgi:peptidoglycan/LPS O-acetylase OafA/YrhL
MFRDVKRIPSLDGLRAISILLVVFGHWAATYFGSPIALSYALLGVRIFFVISGYLITTLLLQERSQTATISLSEFYIRRAYRIFPAATVFLVTMLITRRHELTWYHAAMAAFYLADFDPTRPMFFGHLWSLSVEEQFYLLWPSVLKKWYVHRVRILFAVVALCPFYQVAAYALHYPGIVTHTFFAVADNLAIGCLLAIFAPRLPLIGAWMGFLMAMMVGFIPLLDGVSRARTLILLFLLLPLLYVSIAGVLLHVVQTPYRLLNLAPVVWLGKISYSLYLWQQIFVFDQRPRPWYFILLATGVACLSYYLVEKPMLQLREKRTMTKSSTRLSDVPEKRALVNASTLRAESSSAAR